MKQLYILIKTQFNNFLFATVQGDKRKFGKGIGGKLLVLVPFLVLVYLSFNYNVMFYEVLPREYHHLILYFMTFVASMITFFFGISLAQGHLFTFKDFDLLMSLPIKKNYIMIAKMASFYLIELLYAVFFVVPSLIMYGYHNSVSILFYLYGAIGMLFIPVVPIILASILALVIRKISGKSRFRNIISNILTVALILVISFGSPAIQIDIASGNFGIFQQIFSILQSYLPSIYYYVVGFIETDVLALLISIGISIALGVVYVTGFARIFVGINSDLNEGFKVKNFKLKTSKSQSSFMTLLNKETRKFFSNFMYVLNTSLGQIMLICLAVYLVFYQDMVGSLVSEFSMLGVNVTELVFVILVAALVFCGHMSCPAGVSISLEGKQLWITKSLPMKTVDIFLSKIIFNVLLITIPSMLSFVLIGFVFRFDIVLWLLGILLIISMAFFVGLMGISVNLSFPKLDFDREITVIKQSMSSFITVMGGMALCIALIMVYFGLSTYFIIEPVFYIGVISAMYVICDIILWWYLINRGAKKFSKLYN